MIAVIPVEIDQFTTVSTLSTSYEPRANYVGLSYMRFSKNRHHSIPKEIFNLVNLVHFSVSSILFNVLPYGILNLRKLKMFFYNHCGVEIVEYPKNKWKFIYEGH